MGLPGLGALSLHGWGCSPPSQLPEPQAKFGRILLGNPPAADFALQGRGILDKHQVVFFIPPYNGIKQKNLCRTSKACAIRGQEERRYVPPALWCGHGITESPQKFSISSAKNPIFNIKAKEK